ncbi:anti-adapter protein IraP [Pantoea sp. C2G6]|uniref:anti-adapter protein IraP n=1 Tax=Pantoea sp. C2G6 TaxID=3243084 RepID=UPI003EDB3397
MRQLVIDILLKLAKMDVDAKELTAQLEAQSLLVAALLVQAKQDNSLTITETVQDAIVTASRSSTEFLQSDVDLLLTHINRLLAVAKYVEVKGKATEDEG